MPTRFWLVLALLCVGPLLRAADSVDLTPRIKQEAQKCARAFLKSDWAAVAESTHPRVLALVGGKQAMVEIVRRGFEKMRADGMEFVEANIGEPEKPRKMASWIISLVPQEVVLKVSSGRLRQESFLLGISKTKGRNGCSSISVRSPPPSSPSFFPNWRDFPCLRRKSPSLSKNEETDLVHATPHRGRSLKRPNPAAP